MDVKTIGVVGAGIMGSGIAQIAARSGYNVIIRDIADQFVEKGMAAIQRNLDREVQKGRMSKDEADGTIGRIRGTTAIQELADCDFIIEAAVEKMALKKEIWAELDSVCSANAFFASNTSGLSITEMAAATKRPERFIGMHFFNPVPVMKLVELIRGAETSDETLATAFELTQKMGKEPITVNEAPLFAVNRILCPMINEAIFVLAEGVASASDIDKGMMLGANHPIGPLALADLVGLDTMLFIMDNLYGETGDSKYRACPLLRKKVRAGHLGRKTGKGFFEYNK